MRSLLYFHTGGSHNRLYLIAWRRFLTGGYEPVANAVSKENEPWESRCTRARRIPASLAVIGGILIGLYVRLKA